MENEQLENETPENEADVVEPESTEEVKTEEPVEQDDSKLKSALAQKEHFRKKAEEAEKALEKARKASSNSPAAPLDVEDYIDISASLQGLDQREQAFLAEQHKLTGKSLKDLRESEDFQLWDEAYQARKEKERALAPNSTQELEEAPKSFINKLKGASLAEKEELLKEQGLYQDRRPKVDRADIGQKRSIG